MILTIGTSLALARTMVFDQVHPGGVNRARQVLVCAAGKSINAARAAHALGEPVMVCGVIGGKTGEQLRVELERTGLGHDLVESRHETRVCVSVVDRAAGTTTELVQESQPLSNEDSDRCWEKLLSLVPAAKAVILCGTLAPNVPEGFYGLVCRLARDAGVPTIVDARGPALRAALSMNPTLVKPNREELAATLGRDLPDDASVWEGMDDLLRAGAKCVAVTAGAEGAFFTDGTGSWRLTAPCIEAVNPIGSGDAFAGGFAVGLVRGSSPLEAARLGMACGAANALTLQPGLFDPAVAKSLIAQVSVIVRQIRQDS